MRATLQAVIVSLGMSAAFDVAYADMCAWNDKATAQKAVKILETHDRYLDYCELCNASPTEKRIQDVSYKAVAGEGGKYYEVFVNGEALDIAYAFVPTNEERNKFQNLGKLAGCKTSGVSAFVTYPKEKEPESWAGTYKTKHTTLILEVPTAGTWHHIQLQINASDNGNDRVEVTAQAELSHEAINAKTPFPGCGFVIKRNSAMFMEVAAGPSCGAFGDAISGTYTRSN